MEANDAARLMAVLEQIRDNQAAALAMQKEPGRFRTSSLRASVSAGEALPDATRTLWRESTGIEMLDGIGATEMIHIFIAAAGADVRPGAIGRAVPGYTVAILDDTLRPVPAGVAGELLIGHHQCDLRRALLHPAQRIGVAQAHRRVAGDAEGHPGLVHALARPEQPGRNPARGALDRNRLADSRCQ